MVFSSITLRFHQLGTRARAALVTLTCGALTVLTLSAPSQALIPASEVAALEDFYNSTNGANWTANSGPNYFSKWLLDPVFVCSWYGVRCNTDNTHIAAIELPSNNLTGTLPASFNNLTQLEVLNVERNSISGTLPSLSGMTRLRVFDVYVNQIEGAIPSLQGLTSLEDVVMSANKLTGSIPPLTGLTSLRQLILQANQLSGPIPSLAGLTNLYFVFLRGNALTGSIPPLTGLTSLQTFLVDQNQLSGSMPSLTGLNALQSFDASGNSLTGAIPSLTNLPSLLTFQVQNNQLSGLLPNLSGLPKLSYFNASNNSLSGSIPTLNALPKLLGYHVSNNQLRGSMPSLSGIPTIENFYADNNLLTGTLPSLAGLPALKRIRLGNNQFRGAAPTYPTGSPLLANESALCPNQLTDSFDIGWDLATRGSALLSWHNGCSGTLLSQSLSIGATGATYAGFLGPVIAYAFPLGANSSAPIVYNSITPYVCSVGLTTGIVFVRNNADVGEVCTITADKAGDLFFYSADQVRTTLTVEATVSSFERAALIDLYNSTDGANWITKTNWLGPVGTECTWFGVTCDATKIYIINIALPNNNLNGTLPTTINSFLALRGFNVSGNRLTGAIPSLTDLSLLGAINVSNNQLSGSIPALLQLTQLQSFAASTNALTGNLPSLVGLTELSSFNVSNNQLSGTVPTLSGVASFANLQTFNISLNRFTGALPAIANMPTLTSFDAGDNQLSGVIPSLTGLNNLQVYSATTNQLTGSIPPLSGLARLRVFNVSSNQLTGDIPDLSALVQLLQFNVAVNQLTGSIPALPSPMQPSLLAAVCPNQLIPSSSSAWDAVTGNTPWSQGCTSPLIPQTLTFGPTRPLIVGQSINVFATVAPSPGSTAPIAYGSLTPTLCSINAATELITALPAAVVGDVCIVSADKAGGGTHQSATQVLKQIPIRAIGTCSLDVNGDYLQTPEIDGVLILRYLAGIRGDALIAGLPPHAGARQTARAIEDFLAIHNYGVGGWPASPFPIAQPATAIRDGLVISRYLRGIAPPEMVNGTNISSLQQSRVFDRLESLRCPAP